MKTATLTRMKTSGAWRQNSATGIRIVQRLCW